jgi:hypothetical protein
MKLDRWIPKQTGYVLTPMYRAKLVSGWST